MNELLARIEVDFLREIGSEEVAELDAELDGCRGGCGITALGIIPGDAEGLKLAFVCRGLRPTQAEMDSLAKLIVYDTLAHVGHNPKDLRIRACVPADRAPASKSRLIRARSP